MANYTHQFQESPVRDTTTSSGCPVASTASQLSTAPSGRVDCGQVTVTPPPNWQPTAAVGARNSPKGPGKSPKIERVTAPDPAVAKAAPLLKSAGWALA